MHLLHLHVCMHFYSLKTQASTRPFSFSTIFMSLLLCNLRSYGTARTVLWQQLSLKGESHTLLQVRQGACKFSALNLRTKFCKKTQFRLSGKCMQRSQPHTCAWHAHASCSVVSGEECSHVSHEQLRLLQRSKVPCMHGVPLSHTPCSAERVPGSLK